MDQRGFVELVAASRTYRRFDEGRPVSEEALRSLVGAARLAPTANNTQLLRFHLSTGAEALEVEAHHRWAGLLEEWAAALPDDAEVLRRHARQWRAHLN